MTSPIRLLDVRDHPLSVDEVYTSVVDPRCGGVGLFVGTVRDHDHGRDVNALEYSAHPTVVSELRTIAEAIAERFDVVALSAVHRVGALEIGDIAVVVAVSAAHRGEAMDACRALIDDLKAGAPIWKHQLFSDGEDEWVGSP
ncbi:MAG: molybdenum cofactor biosynthesis protein MoaE [Nocardioidaceae bacterium]